MSPVYPELPVWELQRQMKKHQTSTCPFCQAKMVEYKHTLNKGLCVGLTRLAAVGGEANLKELGLTRNQWDNFQKLRYWDLVTKQVDEAGNRVGGTWVITEKGLDFLGGMIRVPRKVVTYRGERVEYLEETDAVSIHSLLDDF